MAARNTEYCGQLMGAVANCRACELATVLQALVYASHSYGDESRVWLRPERAVRRVGSQLRERESRQALRRRTREERILRGSD
jgi:hypothetical protein